MMTERDLAELDKASGAAFDRMWLTMMISHHQGAIDMAFTERRAGQNTDALALASSIVRTQITEIATMRTQLDG